MSDRTPQQLAAKALRYGLEQFWPDEHHWAKNAFTKPVIVNGIPIKDEKARCVSQMLNESVWATLGHHSPALVASIKNIAGLAILDIARPGFDRGGCDADSFLVALNDSDDTTYEMMRSAVEKGALELEKVE